MLQEQGRPTEAALSLRECLEGSRRTHGDDHPATQAALEALDAALRAIVAEARTATGDASADPGADRLRLGLALAELGAHLLEHGERAEAEAVLAEAHGELAAVLPAGDERVAGAARDLAAARAGGLPRVEGGEDG